MLPTLYEIGYLVNYPEGDYSLQRTPLPFGGGVEDSYHVVKGDDTLLSIAQQYYNNQLLWYIIADANPLLVEDPFELDTNITLLIPNKEILELLNG